MSATNDPARGIQIVYDSECPFCTNYVKLLRLREAIGPAELIDARGQHPILGEIVRAGLDLDEGMVVKMGGRLYHGGDCLNVLALLSTRAGFFNRAIAGVFRSATLSWTLYPSLRAGRNAALRLLGRKRIRDTARAPAIR
jgi:predicted DCC family thiol-disulfide oxidoreductase YuxK